MFHPPTHVYQHGTFSTRWDWNNIHIYFNTLEASYLVFYEISFYSKEGYYPIPLKWLPLILIQYLLNFTPLHSRLDTFYILSPGSFHSSDETVFPISVTSSYIFSYNTITFSIVSLIYNPAYPGGFSDGVTGSSWYFTDEAAKYLWNFQKVILY